MVRRGESAGTEVVALEECRRCAGSQFDRAVVDALVAVVSRQRG